MNARWTAALDARLADLWADGTPAGDIADNLDTTRNAVIGRAHRLGLGPHINRNGTRKPMVDRPVVRQAFDALGSDGCKWPHGDPGEPGFHFCGVRRQPGRPYCAGHLKTAYQPKGIRGPGMPLNPHDRKGADCVWPNEDKPADNVIIPATESAGWRR